MVWWRCKEWSQLAASACARQLFVASGPTIGSAHPRTPILQHEISLARPLSTSIMCSPLSLTLVRRHDLLTPIPGKCPMLPASLRRHRVIGHPVQYGPDGHPCYPNCIMCGGDRLSDDIWQCGYGHLICAGCKEPGTHGHRDPIEGWPDGSCIACHLLVDSGCTMLVTHSIRCGGPVVVEHSHKCGLGWRLPLVVEEDPLVCRQCDDIDEGGYCTAELCKKCCESSPCWLDHTYTSSEDEADLPDATYACPILRLPLNLMGTIMALDLAPKSTHQWDALPAPSVRYLDAMHHQVESVDFALNMECGDMMRTFRTWLISLPDKAFTGICITQARALLVRFADSCIQLSDIRCTGASHSHGSLGPATTSSPYLRLAHISSIRHADAIYRECKGWCDTQRFVHKHLRRSVLQLVCKDWAVAIEQMTTQSDCRVLRVARDCFAKLGATLCRLPAIDFSCILWTEPLREYEKGGAWHWLHISWGGSTYPPSPLSSNCLRRLRLHIEEERRALYDGAYIPCASIEVDRRYTMAQSAH